MAREAKSRACLSCLGRTLLVVLGLVLLVAIVLQVNQRIGLGHTRTQFPPPGEQFPVDDHLIHLRCVGQGAPTVVIDAGNASGSLDWQPIQEQLAANTRVCTFDRAGYLWSEPGPRPRDAATNVRELHALLAAAGEAGPYLLVGHSLGGLHATLYAATWPQEVAGLLLVEAPSVEMIRSAEYQATVPSMVGFYQVMRFLAGSGLLRVLGPLGGSGAMPATVAGLPAEVQEPYLMLFMDPAFYETAIAEVEVIQASAGQVAERLAGQYPLGNLPVLVLTARYTTTGTPMEPGRALASDFAISSQAGLARLSRHGEQRLVEESAHLMHLDAPQAIVEAVEELVIEAR